MKAVIQRVQKAEVLIDGKVIANIDKGILTLLGIEAGEGSNEDKLVKLIQKICTLRIFEDNTGKMNLSLQDVKGEHLIVPQFTLAGDCSTGRRPSFTSAEKPEIAKIIYEKALKISENFGVKTSCGVFQASMEVHLINDGPVTFILEV